MAEPTIADEIVAGGLWHKLCAVLVHQQGGEMRIGLDDLMAIDGKAIVVSHTDDGRTLTLRVMPQAEADRLSDEFQKAARRTN